MLERVRAHVADEFGVPVDYRDPGARPVDTFDVRRKQHSSREMLRWLLTQHGDRSGQLLGITDVDLCNPVLTFVFGEAQLDGHAAVVSFARLLDTANAALTTVRLQREAVHELGHTFGLLHCEGVEASGGRARPCVMARSASVRAVDGKSDRLCPACRARYQLSQQDGTHVYREHQSPHR